MNRKIRRVIEADDKFRESVKKLKLEASMLQGEPLSDREITRRMTNAVSFQDLKREILHDAKMKKFNKKGGLR